MAAAPSRTNLHYRDWNRDWAHGLPQPAAICVQLRIKILAASQSAGANPALELSRGSTAHDHRWLFASIANQAEPSVSSQTKSINLDKYNQNCSYNNRRTQATRLTSFSQLAIFADATLTCEPQHKNESTPEPMRTNRQHPSFVFLPLLCLSASISHADLIAYWPFDEGTGDVAHDVIGGFDGTIIGGGTWVTGKVGASAFQGSGGDEINCGPGPSPTTEDLSLAWWMIDNHVSYGTIMDKSVTGSGYGYNILVRGAEEDSPLRFRIGGWQSYGGWGQECRLPAGAYNDGEWVHIVCTYDSATDTASIYVNGELPENGNLNPKTGIAGPNGYCQGVNNVDTPLSIRGGEENFDGVLDEVAIWDHALTPEEVMAVFISGPGASVDARPFAIIDIDYASAENSLSLSWNSREGEIYTVRYSRDMTTWENDLDDGVEADAGDITTRTFDLTNAGLSGTDGPIFFRVEKQ